MNKKISELSSVENKKNCEKVLIKSVEYYCTAVTIRGINFKMRSVGLTWRKCKYIVSNHL